MARAKTKPDACAVPEHAPAAMMGSQEATVTRRDLDECLHPVTAALGDLRASVGALEASSRKDHEALGEIVQKIETGLERQRTEHAALDLRVDRIEQAGKWARRGLWVLWVVITGVASLVAAFWDHVAAFIHEHGTKGGP